MSLESLSLDTTALLAVDMQNAFCHPEGTLGISGVDVGPAQATIEPVRRLVEAARAARVPVLWTQQEHFPVDASRARKRLAWLSLRLPLVFTRGGHGHAERGRHVQGRDRRDRLGPARSDG